MQMTWDKWRALAPAERAALRDTSELHPQLIGLEGKRVRVTPPRDEGLSTFRVGVTTGWRPVHLAMRGSELGSSDLIGRGEVFASVTVLK